MNYIDAINKLVSIHGLSIFDNQFMTKSILSDYIGSSPYDYRLVCVLYDLLQSLAIVQIFQTNGIKKGRELLGEEFKKMNGICSSREFVDTINPISSLVCPEEYNGLQNQKTNNNGGIAIVRVKEKPQNPLKINVIQRNNPPVKPPAVEINKIKNIAIKGMVDCLIIKKTSVKEPTLFIDGVKQDGDLTKYVRHGVLNLNFANHAKDVEIRLPRKRYGVLYINLDTANIFINEGLHFTEVNVLTRKSGFVYLGQAEKLNLTSSVSKIFINGIIRESNISIDKGNVDASLLYGTNAWVSFNARTSKGHIRVEIVDKKYLYKKEYKLIGFKPKIIVLSNIRNGEALYLNLFTRYGYLSLE